VVSLFTKPYPKAEQFIHAIRRYDTGEVE